MLRRLVRAGCVASMAVSSIGGEAHAQGVTPIVSATDSADTIRVGQVVTLELHIDLPTGSDVGFPAVLPLPEDIEQREAVEVRSRDDRRGWSAGYSLIAWSSDSLRSTPVLATVSPEGGTEFEVTIVPPPIVVSSVLPADEAGLELRDARPYLRVSSFPWWILALIAAAAIAAWYVLRRRGTSSSAFAPTGAGDLAIHELEKLREEWRSGGMSVGEFYDRYERTLRRYARTTRSWSPSRTLIGLTRTGDLFAALRRSLIVRFAHADASREAPESAIDAGERFVRSEMPATDEPAEPGGQDPDRIAEEVAS